MKASKILVTFLILIFLMSCASGKKITQKEVSFTEDKVIARFPAYRIDDRIKNLCIIGNGDGQSEITNFFTQFFTRETNVKIAEFETLQAILGDKVIPYGTGLTKSETQALLQRLQIDHVLLFEDKTSPHKDYEHGGRASVMVSLKIVSTLSGEVIYQTSYGTGITVGDPKKSGYRSISELPTPEFDHLRRECFTGILHELRYAIGNCSIGFSFQGESKEPIVSALIINSIADKMGIKVGDKIIEINGIRLYHPPDMNAILKQLNQGSKIKIKFERERETLETSFTIPVIPFKSEEINKETPTKKRRY